MINFQCYESHPGACLSVCIGGLVLGVLTSVAYVVASIVAMIIAAVALPFLLLARVITEICIANQSRKTKDADGCPIYQEKLEGQQEPSYFDTSDLNKFGANDYIRLRHELKKWDFEDDKLDIQLYTRWAMRCLIPLVGLGYAYHAKNSWRSHSQYVKRHQYINKAQIALRKHLLEV